ncbi:MAG: hypothetical protein HY581_10820 [Nitrospirae bacterium]|nr:hypothetical protein [Nitrospirota bacterium]
MSYDGETLQRQPVDDYTNVVRPRLKSGDLLFASGNYLFSKLIKWVSHSMWSHVGIIFRAPQPVDRLVVLESVEVYGVRAVPLSKYLSDYGYGGPYKGSVYIAEFTTGVPAEMLPHMTQAGCDRLGRRFGNRDILRVLMRLIFRLPVKPTANEITCSELVRDCFAASGIVFRQRDQFVAPEHIASDRRVEFRFRIR